MRFQDIPKVVRYEPNLVELISVGDKLVLKGIELEVYNIVADSVCLVLPDNVKLLYVLENGVKMTQDEWFERYIENIDMEPTDETTRED